MDNTASTKKKENIVAGIFGALLFALLYAVLWVVLFTFWREDVPSWSAFLCTWFSCTGYAFLSAGRKSKLAVLFGSVFGIVFTVLGHAASYFVKLFTHIYGAPADASSFFSNATALLQNYKSLLLTRSYYARFSQQLYIALVMAIVGIVLYCYLTFWSKKAKKEIDGTEASILTEIWSDAPKKQEEIPASPDWIWKNREGSHAEKKAPETLVKNDISSSLLGDSDDSDDTPTGFTPKNNQ